MQPVSWRGEGAGKDSVNVRIGPRIVDIDGLGLIDHLFGIEAVVDLVEVDGRNEARGWHEG